MYTIIPYTTGAVLRDDQSHLLMTYTVNICTVYTIIPYTNGAIQRNYKSYKFLYMYTFITYTSARAVFRDNQSYLFVLC